MVNGKDQEQHPYHRRFIRHKLRLRIHIKLDRSFQSWSKNISEGGMCFDIPEKVEVGREVVASIYLKPIAEEPPVTAIVRVVWNEESEKGTLHGGQFVSFVEDGQQRLQRHLVSLAEKRS